MLYFKIHFNPMWIKARKWAQFLSFPRGKTKTSVTVTIEQGSESIMCISWTTSKDFYNGRQQWYNAHIEKGTQPKTWLCISMPSVPDHCRFLVPRNAQKILTKIWHQFWDGENIYHWNYFQIPPALSELPANWPGLTSLSGWIGWTLKGLVGFENNFNDISFHHH